MPQISVVIPTYNRADLVPLTIDSVLAQSYPDFEIVIIDDGSQDETGPVIERRYSDPRVRYIYQENTGLGGARNAGIRASRGRYVAFLDADDLLLPEALVRHWTVLEAEPEVGLVAGGHRFVDEQAAPLAERRPWETRSALDLETWLYDCPIVPTAVVVEKRWLERVDGFDPTLRRAEDRDLWLRLAYAGCPMAWTPYVVCGYRVHSGQMVNDGRSQKEVTLGVLRKFFSRPELPPQIQTAAEKSYAGTYLEGAFREYGANQPEFAQESLSRAIEGLPELMQGERPPLVGVLVAWAANPITGGDPSAYVERVLAHLPPAASGLEQWRQSVLFEAVIRAVVEAHSVQNHTLAHCYLQDAWRNGVRLEADPTLTLELLTNRIKSRPLETGLALVEAFFAHLPVELAGLAPLRRQALARLYVARGFAAQRAGAAKEAGQALWQGARLDPRWLRDRGVWKIILKALTGSLSGGS